MDRGVERALQVLVGAAAYGGAQLGICEFVDAWQVFSLQLFDRRSRRAPLPVCIPLGIARMSQLPSCEHVKA